MVKAVFVEFVSFSCSKSSRIEVFYNGGNCFTACVSFEDFKNDGGFFGIELIMLFFINYIAVRNNATVELTFEGVFSMTSCNLFRKIC